MTQLSHTSIQQRRPRRSGLAMALAAVLVLAACDNDTGTKETVGLLGGAVAGGLLGSQFGSGSGRLIMTGAGVLAGSMIGRNIGRNLDKKDRLEQERAAQQALENTRSGQTVKWNNPDSGNSGTITPTKTFQNAQGQYCREIKQTITIDGNTEEVTGTACRQPDASWVAQ